MSYLSTICGLRLHVGVVAEQRVVDQHAVDVGDGLRGPDRVEHAHVGVQHGAQHLLLGLGRADRGKAGGDRGSMRDAAPRRVAHASTSSWLSSEMGCDRSMHAGCAAQHRKPARVARGGLEAGQAGRRRCAVDHDAARRRRYGASLVMDGAFHAAGVIGARALIGPAELRLCDVASRSAAMPGLGCRYLPRRSSSMTSPRVAILGLALESNRWSRPAGEEDFKSACWLEGDAILHEARAATPAMPMEAAAFVKAMDATGPWQPVPILIASSFPAGPIEQATFERVLAIMLAGLEAALPLDAVYICNHGAHDRDTHVRPRRRDRRARARRSSGRRRASS